MKKSIIIVAAAIMISGCGFLKNSTSSNTTATPANTNTTATTTATTATAENAAQTAGQGAGNAILALYNQYKADGNKYDYKNLQNALNTITLISNCEGLKDNYKNKTYLTDFGKGMVASSLGLVTEDNAETVTNSLVEMVKSSETVQNAKEKTVETANAAAGYADTAASYANTAAQYAGALSSLLSAFGK